MSYAIWLAIFALFFYGLERLWPNERRHRTSWSTDIVHLIVNSHVWGIAVAVSIGRWLPDWNSQFTAGWPLAGQALVLVLAQDFAQW